MIDDGLQLLTIVVAVAAGLVGGVFFAFSTFVMAGLRRLPPATAVSAMQAINREAPTAPFMALFLGTAAASLVLAVVALTRLGEPATPWQLAGCAAYLATILLTAGFHVPRNDALAGVDPDGAGAASAWERYAGPWVAANHLRTLGGAASAVLLALALVAD